jgi:hypothetical protein
MKYKILLPLLLLALTTAAQRKQKLAYAITSSLQGQFSWTDVRLVDLSSGDVIQPVFENGKSEFPIFSARDGKAVVIKNAAGEVTDHSRLPFTSYSAACAYDKKHNRLYYTPMFVNELRYIDLNGKSPKIFYFDKEGLSQGTNLQDESNHITRMTIGSDGSGYAISNDGKRFIKFTTGKKPTITELGSLRDDAANSGVSIHNRCTSWGGDMVAAADGSLYIFSANKAVFKVDVNNRTALYKGIIEGLPNNFTANGVAVNGNNTVVVSSANSVSGYYEVDINDLKASKVSTKETVFNASDLANGDLLFDEVKSDRVPLITRTSVGNNAFTVYPNPVTERLFRVSFDNEETGRYSIQVVDLTGRLLQMKEVMIASKGQTVEVELNNKIAKGVYFVKLLSKSKKLVFTDKIIVD